MIASWQHLLHDGWTHRTRPSMYRMAKKSSPHDKVNVSRGGGGAVGGLAGMQHN
jgi:hypothetical protein